jgi:hypothetical protein
VVGFAVLVTVAVQTLQVRNENLALVAMIRRDRAPVVAVGDRIGDLVGTKVNGLQARYRLLGARGGSLVIEMSSNCGFCQRSFAAWRRLSLKARRLGLQVVWVSRDTTGDRAGSGQPLDLDESLIADPTYPTYVQLKLATVPQTLIVPNDGVVTHARVGLVEASAEQSLSNSIDVMVHRRH